MQNRSNFVLMAVLLLSISMLFLVLGRPVSGFDSGNNPRLSAELLTSKIILATKSLSSVADKSDTKNTSLKFVITDPFKPTPLNEKINAFNSSSISEHVVNKTSKNEPDKKVSAEDVHTDKANGQTNSDKPGKNDHFKLPIDIPFP